MRQSARAYKYAGCGVYLWHEEAKVNKIRFDQLAEHKEEIEKNFGGELNWEKLDNRRTSRISVKFKRVGLKDKDKWDVLQTKMIDAMIRLEKTFEKHIRQLE